MLLSLWPLFLIVDTSAIDTPEVLVIQDIIELIVVSTDIGVYVVREF